MDKIDYGNHLLRILIVYSRIFSFLSEHDESVIDLHKFRRDLIEKVPICGNYGSVDAGVHSEIGERSLGHDGSCRAENV